MSLKRSREIAERLTTTEKFKDFPWFCENYLRVLNRPETSMHGKVGETVPLKLNPIQLDFYEKLMAARKAGKPGRFIVLKARRMGLSTVTQALAFHQCLTNRDRRAFVTAVDRITTNNVFLMAKKMYDNLPSKGSDGGKPTKYEDPDDLLEALDKKAQVEDLRPELRRNNDNELWMTHPLDETAGLNSRFEVSVADAVHSTRGFEIHYFHGSEIGFWSDPETFMLGLMQTISDDPETLVVLESTANGTGGYFHREFWKAWKGEDSRGNKIESDWEAIFYPWHSMPNYKRELPEGVSSSDILERFDESLMGMIQEYDLSPEQAYWAHKTWMDKCQGDWNLFKQEYPGKPEEAFAFSASRVFEEPALAAVEKAGTTRPLFVGWIVDSSDKASPEKRVNLAGYMEPELSGKGQSASEALWVWEYPEEGVKYIVAVAPASGRSSGDYTAIQVIRADTRVQVAEVQAKMEALQTSEIAVLLCIHYNEALLSWEINGVGHAVSLGIMQTEYWNLYQRENIEAVNFDARYGWTTSVATKPVMVHVGIDIINSKMPVIRSERLMREMRMFMELTRKTTSSVALVAGDEMHKRVKVGAPPGEHDDLVMSWLQAQAVCDIEYGSVSRADPRKKELPTSNGMAWFDEEEDLSRNKRSLIGARWL
mgnify:CR=1 FL=1